jgi:hypothetical protein
MKNRFRTFATGITSLMIIMLIVATSGFAAEFSLAWDPNCNEDPTLIGYTIYYNTGTSVLADPNDANMVYIALNDPAFDPDHPSYQFTNLQDGVEYFFTVSAVYEDGESDMSNEISGQYGISDPNPSGGSNLSPTQSSSTGSSSGGCFISSLF